MSLLNLGLIEKYISNNQVKKRDTNGKPFTDIVPVPYRWTHGATDLHLGDGMIIYSTIQMMRAKVCVCLGSGGGFIPRIMTQARVDLHDQKIFSGLKQMEWGDCGTTFIVDADNGVGGFTDWTNKRSFFRKNFDCRVILDTTENAFYNFFVKEDIKIDYLHIDAGHSYDDVKKDFTLYSSILSDYGVISIHDTDESFEKELIVTEDVKEKNHHAPFDGPTKLIKELKESNEWELFNFFNNGVMKEKPSTTGLTLIQRCRI